MSTAHRSMFRDKVFIIRKLTKFLSRFEFLLFPRIQTDWFQSAHCLQVNDTQSEKTRKKRRRGGKKGRKRKEKEEEKRRRKKKRRDIVTVEGLSK